MQDHKLKIMNDIHIEWVLIEQMKSKENSREAESHSESVQNRV